MNTLVQTIGRFRVGNFAGGAVNLRPVGVAVLGLTIGAGFLFDAFGSEQAALYIIGGALGVVLYHAAFGFTSAWRVFLSDRRGAGLRAQMVMLGVASLLFLPALAEGSLFGRPIIGAVAPLNVSLLVGAFLFGIGMQLGGGCASGTLFTAGGGNSRMWVTPGCFHRRFRDRDPACSVVVRPARVFLRLAGTGFRPAGGADHPVRRVRRDLCPDDRARKASPTEKSWRRSRFARTDGTV